MPSKKRKFGDLGEKIAGEYLINKGYKIIDRNYWKPWGEIDLVVKNKDNLVFVEVKTRDARYVKDYLAEYSVNRSKIKKLAKICETYLYEKKLSLDQKWQVDVIAIAIDEYNKVDINHIENAVWEKPY